MKTVFVMITCALVWSALAPASYAQQTTGANGSAVDGYGNAGNQDNRYDRRMGGRSIGATLRQGDECYVVTAPGRFAEIPC